eukprot:4075517-Pleurochrysis_carterae.AAC.1
MLARRRQQPPNHLATTHKHTPTAQQSQGLSPPETLVTRNKNPLGAALRCLAADSKACCAVEPVDRPPRAQVRRPGRQHHQALSAL